MSAKRSAVYSAFTVSVECPSCGEPQPSPSNESLFWTVEELAREIMADPGRTCGSCDELFVLRPQSKTLLALDVHLPPRTGVKP